MRARWMLALLPLLSAPGLSGCGTRGELYTQPLSPLPLLATNDALVSVVPGTESVVILPADGSTPRAHTISPGARAAALTPDASRLLILGGEVKAPTLDILELSSGARNTVSLFGPFDQLSFSPDGRRALLSYAAGAQVPGLAARNLNEVALVELGSSTVTRLQLDTGSVVPRSVVFGPASDTRQLVAVTFNRGVAVFDAAAPEKSPRRIVLQPPGSTAEVGVEEALFSPDGNHLFLRAEKLDDVIVVSLGKDEGTGELTAALNFIAGGTGLSDIALTGLEALPHAVLAVFSESQEVRLLDAGGVEDVDARLSLPAKLRRVELVQPGRALVFDSEQLPVVGWDLVTRRSGVAALESPPVQQLFSTTLDGAVFLQGSQRHPNAALTVVTLEEEAASQRVRPRLQSIQLAAPAGPSLLSPSGRAFVITLGTFNSTLVSVDVSDLTVSQVTLDSPAQRLLHVPGAATLAAIHNEKEVGDLTWLPSTQLERSAARRVSGYNLTGDLNRPEAQ